MIILGIDPGTARMGYSIIKVKNKAGDYKVIEADVLTTSADQEMHKRLKSLHVGLHRILAKHKPDIMVIERLFFNSNAKTAMTVGKARGVAWHELWQFLQYEGTVFCECWRRNAQGNIVR